MSIAKLIGFILIASCGVKNDPIPPGTASDMGQGRPRPRAWLLSEQEAMDPSKIQVLDSLEERQQKKTREP